MLPWCKSVETITGTIAGGATSIVIALTKGQNAAHCWADTPTMRVASNSSHVDEFGLEVVVSGSPASVTVTRGTNGAGSRSVTFSIPIIEVDPAYVRVQKILFPLTADNNRTETIPVAVNLSRTFATLHLYQTSGSTNDTNWQRVEFNSATEVRVNRAASGGNSKGTVYVVEALSDDVWKVQPFSAQLINAAVSTTVAITAVDLARSMIVATTSVESGLELPDAADVSVSFASTVQLLIQRAGPTSSEDITMAGFVVEFAAGNAVVQRAPTHGAYLTFNAASTDTITMTTAVNADRSWGRMRSPHGMFSANGTNGRSTQQVAQVYLLSGTQIRGQNDSPSAFPSALEVDWDVVYAPPSLNVTSAVALTQTTVLVSFDSPISATGLAVVANAYAITGNVLVVQAVPHGSPVGETGGYTAVLLTVAPLVSGVVYTVTVSPLLVDVDGDPIVLNTASFSWVAPSAVPVVSDGDDIANPQLSRDAVTDGAALGQYEINDRGDWAVTSRVEGLRKRLLRRISTARGGFFHLPGYGASQPIKGVLRPGVLRALAADLRLQVLSEPDVVQAQVSMQQDPRSPYVVIVAVRVRTTTGLDLAASQALDLRTGVA